MAEKRARVNRIDTVAPDIVRIDLAAVEPARLGFRAGQFVSLRLDAHGDLRRSYSIASSPARADGFELVVKLVPGGAGSARLAALAPGDEVGFTGPLGFFTVAPAHEGDVVFVATGVGIAPFAPMLEETLARAAEPGAVRLFWGVRHEADLFWRERFDALAAAHARFSWQAFVSKPGPGWAGAHGRVTPALLDAVPGLGQPRFYLCGSRAMIDDVRAGLGALGVGRKRIASEIFFD